MAWEDAETIAAIADSLTPSVDVELQLERLCRRAALGDAEGQ